MIKIASSDNNYFELIKTVSSFNLPLIISTGLLEINGINEIIKILNKQSFDLKKLTLLHCVADYPVEPSFANLNSIKYLIDKTTVSIGYSDHTQGNDAAIAAVAIGAKIIEKHFTLDKNFSDFRDHQISADPTDMKKLVRSIRTVEKQIGIYQKIMQKNEMKNELSMRRSIYSKQDLNKGDVLELSNVKFVRPFKHLTPNQFKLIDGKILKVDIKNDKALSIDDFE